MSSSPFSPPPEIWRAFDSSRQAELARLNTGPKAIHNLRFTSRTTDFFDMLIDIAVRDVRHLTTIIAALRGQKVVAAVERARS